MAGELGMEIDLDRVPAAQGLKPSHVLYSETCGRFIITVAPDRKDAFEAVFSGLIISQVGIVTESPLLSVKDNNGQEIISEDIMGLKDSWKKPFGDLI